ncbi:MAG TPA: Ldh family oxidoreductase [Bacteroidales bacterium]|nr:Ldh family oxidoreductase [Bacteroidales bacterium]
MEEEKIFIEIPVLEHFVKSIFIKAGVPESDANICASVLIEADKLGIDSHGVNRLKPIYIDRIKEGIINPITNIEIIKEAPATALIDGHNGMGQVVAYKSMNIAIDKAKKYGIGMVAVRNSNHYGIAGYYGLMATKQNMIGITGTNARPSIAPTFGSENMLGTNPLTFVMPTDEDFPFFLDCATSVSQRGKIEYYARKNKDIPEGWVIDKEGNYITNSNEALKALSNGIASMVPLGGIGEKTGGYKGYGYATVVEILSAALQGGAYLKMLLGIENGKKVPFKLGHFFIAINISAFIEPAIFKKISGDILRELRNSDKMSRHDKIYTPGEKEYLIYKERKIKGIPINIELLEELNNLAVEYGVNKLF